MIVHSSVLRLHTSGFNDCKNITPNIERLLEESAVSDGILTVMIAGSTAAITTIEFEYGAVSDLKDVLEKIAPMDKEYSHNVRWEDGNGFSHIRAALMKPSLTIPVVSGKLCLGTWQQVVFLDFDNRPRHRSVIVQIMGK